MYNGAVVFLTVLTVFVSVVYGQHGNVCRKCPRKESCRVPDKNDCRAYYTCENNVPIHMRCGFGTLFDRNSTMCIHPANADCPQDVCRDQSRKSYGDHHDRGSNCRSYWKCVNRLSTAACCDNGNSYDTYSGKCMKNDTCDSSCKLIGTNGGITEEGTLRVVCEGAIRGSANTSISCRPDTEIRVISAFYEGAEASICATYEDTSMCPTDDVTNKFKDYCNKQQRCIIDIPSLLSNNCNGKPKQVKIRYVCEAGCTLIGTDGEYVYRNKARAETEMHCGPGTHFDSAACGCVSSGEIVNGCTIPINITFGNNETTKIENDAQHNAYVEAESVEKTLGYGRFVINSWLSMPFFEGNDNLSKKFAFRLRVFPTGTGDHKHVLLSTCQTASLEIYFYPPDSRIYFKAVNDADVEQEVSLPYFIGQWSNIFFSFNGSSMLAVVQVVNPNTKNFDQKEAHLAFIGKLKTGTQPLRVGACTLFNGINGYIDEIQVSFCDPQLPEVREPVVSGGSYVEPQTEAPTNYPIPTPAK